MTLIPGASQRHETINKDKALELYHRGLSLKDEALELYHRGVPLEAEKKYDEAIQIFTDAVQNDENNADIQNERGNAELELAIRMGDKKKYRNTLSFFDAALSINPSHAMALSNKGFILSQTGDPELIKEGLGLIEK